MIFELHNKTVWKTFEDTSLTYLIYPQTPIACLSTQYENDREQTKHQDKIRNSLNFAEESLKTDVHEYATLVEPGDAAIRRRQPAQGRISDSRRGLFSGDLAKPVKIIIYQQEICYV